jgi:hypothetical protein
LEQLEYLEIIVLSDGVPYGAAARLDSLKCDESHSNNFQPRISTSVIKSRTEDNGRWRLVEKHRFNRRTRSVTVQNASSTPFHDDPESVATETQGL